MAQKNRKIHGKRGSRTCGYGNAKKHRGAGSRGGRGRAGSGKHKQVKSHIEGRVFGKKGFKRHPSLIARIRTINVSDIDKNIEAWAEGGTAGKKASSYSADMGKLGYDKVLGSGRITHKIEITAGSFSKSAREKIEAAGGKAITNDVDTA